MLKCDERIACAQALSIYELLDDKSKSNVPKDFLSYLKSNSGPYITRKFAPNLIVKKQGFTKDGELLVKKLLGFEKSKII